jgi:hypothetical protein
VSDLIIGMAIAASFVRHISHAVSLSYLIANRKRLKPDLAVDSAGVLQHGKTPAVEPGFLRREYRGSELSVGRV